MGLPVRGLGKGRDALDAKGFHHRSMNSGRVQEGSLGRRGSNALTFLHLLAALLRGGGHLARGLAVESGLGGASIHAQRNRAVAGARRRRAGTGAAGGRTPLQRRQKGVRIRIETEATFEANDFNAPATRPRRRSRTRQQCGRRANLSSDETESANGEREREGGDQVHAHSPSVLLSPSSSSSPPLPPAAALGYSGLKCRDTARASIENVWIALRWRLCGSSLSATSHTLR